METYERKGLKWAEAPRTGIGIGENNSLVDREREKEERKGIPVH